ASCEHIGDNGRLGSARSDSFARNVIRAGSRSLVCCAIVVEFVRPECVFLDELVTLRRFNRWPIRREAGWLSPAACAVCTSSASVTGAQCVRWTCWLAGKGVRVCVCVGVVSAICRTIFRDTARWFVPKWLSRLGVHVFSAPKCHCVKCRYRFDLCVVPLVAVCVGVRVCVRVCV
uniref:Uncharacterized protein n=1 Tax=Anopheles albimanus TaxID=7167 RepID=A0A182FC42_ANOAL